jgi:hypothetical protein
MEEITIGLFDEPDVVDWDLVDAILAQPQFSKLGTFCICINNNRSAWFMDHLPRSCARDILSIQSPEYNSTIL